MRVSQTLAAFLLVASTTSSQQASAAETKTYWDHGFSSDCRSQRRPMMQTAMERAQSWCRSRGGLDRKRTNLDFIVDKGMPMGPGFRTHYCEVKGTIVCN